MVDVDELTFWFYVQNHGFIDQVQEFASSHKQEFVASGEDGHSLKETELHAEFQALIEAKVRQRNRLTVICGSLCQMQEYLDSKGQTMEQLQEALQEITVEGVIPGRALSESEPAPH